MHGHDPYDSDYDYPSDISDGLKFDAFYDTYDYGDYDPMNIITTKEVLAWLHIDDEGTRDVWDKPRDWSGAWIPLYSKDTIQLDDQGVPTK
jgi:hypothetical protein